VRFKRILMAVDDGSYADQLVTAAAGLTSQEGAQVLVVHVSELAACCGAVDHPALHAHEHAAVRSLVESLRTWGVQAQSQLRTTTSGRVAEHLLDVAEGWHADLVLAAVGQPGRFRAGPGGGCSRSCSMTRLARCSCRPAMRSVQRPTSSAGRTHS
jgi:nucleotide-binding universal stress UspA family protein